MKILFVVPNVPSPIRARPYNFIRRLAQSHQVSVLCLATDETEVRFGSELRRHCHSLEIVRLPRWRSLANCLTALLGARWWSSFWFFSRFSSSPSPSWFPLPLRCAYFYSSALRRRLEEKVREADLDLVHAEHLKSLAMVEGIVGKVAIVFDAVDCVSGFESRRGKLLRNPLLKIFSASEEKKMAAGEATACEMFERVVITSAIDRESFAAAALPSEILPEPEKRPEKIEVIPNGVDLEYFSFRRFVPRKNLIVFCAKLDYFPNQDAARYFSLQVWPLLRAKRPELKLEIIGSRPPSRIRELDGTQNIRVLGSVPDVRPYLGRAWVALCPLRLQGGIQNKILEAMALGVPVVATRICCPALAVEPGKHLLTADTPAEFAAAIELLLDQPALREKLVRAGRSYVEQHHDWNTAVQKLSAVYGGAVAGFRSASDARAPSSAGPEQAPSIACGGGGS